MSFIQIIIGVHVLVFVSYLVCVSEFLLQISKPIYNTKYDKKDLYISYYLQYLIHNIFSFFIVMWRNMIV
jgi:hypothetical protein